MKHFSRHSSTQAAAGLALAFGGLFLMSSNKPASADGYFMFDVTTPTDASHDQADPGSGTTFIDDQTSSVGSYSTYDAKPGTSDSAAHIDRGEDIDFLWYNADGNTPHPHGKYIILTQASIDGTVTIHGGATAKSSANYLPEQSADSAHPTYSEPASNSDTRAWTSSALRATGNIHAATSASPDDSNDPKNENYGQPTVGAAGASVGVTVNQDNSSPPLS